MIAQLAFGWLVFIMWEPVGGALAYLTAQIAEIIGLIVATAPIWGPIASGLIAAAIIVRLMRRWGVFDPLRKFDDQELADAFMTFFNRHYPAIGDADLWLRDGARFDREVKRRGLTYETLLFPTSPT